MGTFYVLGSKQVKRLLTLKEVVHRVEQAYVLKATGQGGLFPVITHEWIPGSKDMDIKSGYFDGDVNIYGLKALTYIEDNAKVGLPCLMGTMMVFDSLTGQMKALLDATQITGYRTGAAGAIGSRYLARPDSRVLLLGGAGKQALFNLAANLITMPGLERVLVCDPVSGENSRRFAGAARQRLETEFFADDQQMLDRLATGLTVEAVDLSLLGQAAGEADIITTVTPATTPFIKEAWLKPGVHLNCVGADMSGKEEVEAEIFARARVIVDDLDQAISIGETEIPYKKGLITRESIIGEMGQVICGQVAGRASDQDVTLFDTTGISLQDLVTADLIINKAEKEGLPTFEWE